MIVPLSLMWAFKPVRRIPLAEGIAELFAETPSPAKLVREGGW